MTTQGPPPPAASFKSELRVKKLFDDVVIRDIDRAPESKTFNYQGFQPGSQVLKAGFKRAPGRRQFGVDTIFDRDVEIVVRDGARIFTDVFRPASSESEPVPALIPWSPYGKSGTGSQDYDNMAPFRVGIPKERTSGYEKFEAPDPAEWSERGYAVINVDARGAGHSDGIVTYFGDQEAEDIYDVIEWLIKQKWCNGSVVMAGNSWLSLSQINFASRMKHSALKALAPWESFNDFYRHAFSRGGRPHLRKFHAMISGGMAGPEGAEDVFAMTAHRPLYDDYWEEKRIAIENIDGVPVYALASYSSILHTYGSFALFRDSKTNQKWLRVHPYQEWYDIYRDDINDDLQKYFDRFAKGIKNGWDDSTPPVRLSLLGFESGGGITKTIVERAETSYPLEREELRIFYLDGASGKLFTDRPSAESIITYEAHHLTDSADFTLYFDQQTELAGYSKATVWVSTPDHDDMDVAVQIRKINAQGKPLKHLNYPCPVPEAEVPDVNTAKTLGPQGFLRASHRGTLDRSKSSSDVDLFYTHRFFEKIKPGTKVRLEIPLWPIGMVFAPGEGIMFRVSGHDMSLPEIPSCTLTEPDDENVGKTTLHTGGEFDSSIVLPFILG